MLNVFAMTCAQVDARYVALQMIKSFALELLAAWISCAQKAPKQLGPLFVTQAPQKGIFEFTWIIGTPQKYLAIGCPSTVHAIAVFEIVSAILTAPRRRLCESVGVGTAGKLHLPCPLFSHRR